MFYGVRNKATNKVSHIGMSEWVARSVLNRLPVYLYELVTCDDPLQDEWERLDIATSTH